MRTDFPRKIDRKGIKAQAKQVLKKKLWPMRAVVLVSVLIPVASGALPRIIDACLGRAAVASASVPLWSIPAVWPANPGLFALRTLLGSACAVLGAWLSCEIGYFFLRVFRHEKVRDGEFFRGLASMPGRKIGAWFWMQLWVFLWAPLANLNLATVLAKLLLGAPLSQALGLVITGVSIACLIIGLNRSLAYGQMQLLIREYPQVTVRQAMRLSIRMTRGYLWQIFLFGLSFAGWVLLVLVLPLALTLVFNVLVLPILLMAAFCILYMPYVVTAVAGLYEELKQRALASGAISQADLAQPIAKKAH